MPIVNPKKKKKKPRRFFLTIFTFLTAANKNEVLFILYFSYKEMTVYSQIKGAKGD